MRLAKTGKWTKFKLMRPFPSLLPFLPDTRWMTESNFWHMLEQYGIVIVKPNRGCMGLGVIQVCARPDDRCLFQFENHVIEIQSRERAYLYLRTLMGKREYIVQLWIPLATVNQCPFDIRVMVQRRSSSQPWTVTGKLARIADEGYIITNVLRKPCSVEEAIHLSNVNQLPPPDLMARIDSLSLQASELLGQTDPKLLMIGLDIGIDYLGHLWIIEANLRKPAFQLFKNVDAAMYKTILKYRR